MARSVPQRYVWAADILDVQPGDEILEIGCGYGHSIPLISPKIAGGKLTLIDRSEKMVTAVTQSYKDILVSGNVSVLGQDLLDRYLPASHFDKIFLFNINAFWMDPAAELEEVRRLSKRGGRFFLFHQPPPGHDLDEFENVFRTNLEKNDFLLIDHFKERRERIGSVALISTPNPR